MDEYDGSVVIKTGLDLQNIEKDAAALQKAIGAATAGVKALQDVAKQSAAAQLDMLRNANAGWSEQLRIVRELRDTLASMPAIPASRQTRTGTARPAAPVDELGRLQADADALDKQLERLTEKADKMIALYGQQKAAGMTAFKSIQYDIDRVIERYNEVQSKIQEVTAARAMAAETATQVPPVVNAETAAEMEPARKEVEKTAETYAVLATQMKRAKTEAVKTTKAVTHHSGLSLKNVLKYAFGIRSVFVLMRRLRAAAKESLGVMAQFDPALNRPISEFLTAVKQLKADLGTMLQPLVSAAAPVFTMLLDKIHSAALELSRFFAALVGQDYINVAKVQAVDYADSLRDVGDAASEALGEYDKLSVINSKQKDTKNTLELTKDTVKYTKEALNNNSWTVRLGRRLREIFDWAGGKIESLKEWLEKQPFIQKITENLQKLLNDPDGFLALIGATLVVSKLAKLITGGVTSGVNNGLTSSKLGQGLILTVTAVIGFKIGNYLYNNFEEVRNAANGFIDELFGDPQKQLNSGGKEGKGVIGEYTDAYMKKGIGGIVEQWFSNVGEVLSQSFEIRKGSIADALINHDDIPVRMPKIIIPELTEAEKNVLAQQNARRAAQEKANVAAARAAFIAAVSPYWEDIKLQFTVGFEAKFGKTPAQALQELKDKFTTAWNNPGNKLKTAIDTAAQNLKTWWSNIFPDSKTANFKLGEKMRALGEKISKSWATEKTTIKSELDEIKSELSQLMGDAWTGAFTDVFDGTKKVGGAATGKLGKIVSYSGKNSFKGLAEEIESRLNNSFTQSGQTAAQQMITGFNAAIKADTTMAQTFAQKITAAIAASYAAASLVYSALYTPLLAGKVTPTQAGKTATTTTTVGGDIVLKLDGKEISRVVWDNTKQQYKQTGKSLLTTR